MKKKLRFFITSLDKGGAEKVLIDLLSWLNTDWYDLSLTVVYGGEHEKRIPPHVWYHRLVKDRNNALRRLLIKAILKMPRRLFARLFLRGEYDYEVAYLEGRTTRFLAAKKTTGKKITFVECDLSVSDIIAPLYKSRQECLEEYRSFDKVCFVSDGAMEGFEKTYGKLDNARVIHAVLDVSNAVRLADHEAKTTYTTNGLKLVAIGRLAPEKNFEALIRVVGELEKEHDIELLLLGEGEQRAMLEGLMRDRQIRSVRLLGFCDNPYPYIRQADLLVCSSLFEGYSTVVCEAVTLHTPVVTTDCAGMADILDHGRYGLITENSYDGLRNGLKQILDNPSMMDQYKENLKDYHFQDSVAVNAYRDLFDME